MLEWRGALVDRKRYLKPASADSQGQHSSIYVFLCLCVCLFVCLFVSVFESTRVDIYTEITCAQVNQSSCMLQSDHQPLTCRGFTCMAFVFSIDVMSLFMDTIFEGNGTLQSAKL